MLAGRKTTMKSELKHFYPNYIDEYVQVPDMYTQSYGVFDLTFLNYEEAAIAAYYNMKQSKSGAEYNNISNSLLIIHKKYQGELWQNENGELIELSKYNKDMLEYLHLTIDRRICTLVLNLATSDHKSTQWLQREWIEEYKLKLKRIEELCNTLEDQKYTQETEHQ